MVVVDVVGATVVDRTVVGGEEVGDEVDCAGSGSPLHPTTESAAAAITIEKRFTATSSWVVVHRIRESKQRVRAVVNPASVYDLVDGL